MSGAARASVIGWGAVGGFGAGRADLLAALERGGVTPQEVRIALPGGEVALPALRADLAPVERFVPRRQLRRYDRYATLALLAAHLALEDASALEADRSAWGLVVGTGFGSGSTFDFLDSYLRDGDLCASPTHFSNSVSNSAAALTAIALGIRGPSLTVSQGALSFPCALEVACGWLAEGRVGRLLVGGVDQHLDLIAYSEARLLGDGADAAFDPLAAAGPTALLSEGAAFFVLSGEGRARCRLSGAGSRHLGLGPPPFSAAPLLLAADGCPERSARYREVLPSGRPVRAYAPLYGSLPSGAALGLAAACLCVEEARLFAPPGSPAAAEPLPGREVQLLACDASGRYQLLTVAG